MYYPVHPFLRFCDVLQECVDIAIEFAPNTKKFGLPELHRSGTWAIAWLRPSGLTH
jgi:hypothetical protein